MIIHGKSFIKWRILMISIKNMRLKNHLDLVLAKWFSVIIIWQCYLAVMPALRFAVMISVARCGCMMSVVVVSFIVMRRWRRSMMMVMMTVIPIVVYHYTARKRKCSNKKRYYNINKFFQHTNIHNRRKYVPEIELATRLTTCGISS